MPSIRCANRGLISNFAAAISIGFGDDFAEPAEHARKISEVMKSAQFQLARAVTRRKFEPLNAALEPAADAWDQLMESAGNALA